jgi:L-ascorbate metabolism protein UlaG (beta-lactamase superfamily)
MFKTLIFISFITFLSFPAWAKVEMKWFGVASIILDDGQTQIFFDPMFTRADFKHLFNATFKSDEKLVKDVLEEYQLSRIRAVFASHSHFDHVVDAPIVAKLAGGTFFTDQNSEIIARAYQDPGIKTQMFIEGQRLEVGKFVITPILRDHSEILHLFEFLPGKVRPEFSFGFWEYRVGDTWCFLIEHPDGRIFIDQGANPWLEKVSQAVKQADVVIQGVANRKDDEAIVNGYVKALNSKKFVPAHFDNFFMGFSDKGISRLPRIRLEELLDKITSTYPGVSVVMPRFGEGYVLLEGK